MLYFLSMAAEKGPKSEFSKKLDERLHAERDAVSRWLVQRGLATTAVGALVAAGWLLIKGGTVGLLKTKEVFLKHSAIAKTALGFGIIAPPVVAIGAGVAAAGLVATGVGLTKRVVDRFRG